MHKKNPAHINFIIGILFLLLVSGLASCRESVETPIVTVETTAFPLQSSSTAEPTNNMGSATNTPEVSTPDPTAIQAAWQSSPHAHTYVLDENGQNNTCARCHAPINWMPTMDDLPESCFACKFVLEAPPQTISEADWTDIPCKICHKVDKKGNVQPEFAWLEIAPLDEYADVASASELCLKCHAPVDIPGHGTVQVSGAHAGYECTRCHPAHETTTSCDPAGCHPALDNPIAPIPGHDQDHQSVTCVACHDGSGMEVGPDEQTGLWTTFISGSANGSTEKFAFTSHNVVLEAKCDRCHFENNPWGLSDNVVQP